MTFAPWLSSDPTDHVAPSVSITSGPSGTTDQTLATFEYTSNDPTATFLCRLDTPTVNGAYLPCASPKAYADLADGAHVFHIVVADVVGNSSEAVQEWTVQVIPPTPILTGIGQAKVVEAVEVGVEEGGMTSENVFRIKGHLISPLGRQVKLQVEAKKVFDAFNGSDIVESAFTASGSDATVELNLTLSKPSTQHGPYHWRARSVDSQGLASDWTEFGAVGNKDFQRAFKVGVFFADFSDTTHESTSLSAQPCKLIPTKTYSAGHAVDYYQDLQSCVNDYYRENTYETIQYDFVPLSGGSWIPLPLTMAQYANSIVETLIDDTTSQSSEGQGVNAAVDVLVIVHAGDSANFHLIETGRIKDQILYHRVGYAPTIVVAEDDFSGPWDHELSHAAGILTLPEGSIVPDVYNMLGGNTVRQWDLMSGGGANGGAYDSTLDMGDGSNPALMSSFVRAYLGLLTTTQSIPKSAYGTYPVPALADSVPGSSVVRYNFAADTTNVTEDKYYILETRDKRLGNWDDSTPENGNARLILYKADKKGFPAYGYGADMEPLVESWALQIPGNKKGSPTINDGVLSVGESFDEMESLARFTAMSYDENTHTMDARISQLGAGSWSTSLTGVIFDPGNLIPKSVNGGRSYLSGSEVPSSSVVREARLKAMHPYPIDYLIGLQMIATYFLLPPLVIFALLSFVIRKVYIWLLQRLPLNQQRRGNLRLQVAFVALFLVIMTLIDYLLGLQEIFIPILLPLYIIVALLSFGVRQVRMRLLQRLPSDQPYKRHHWLRYTFAILFGVMALLAIGIGVLEQSLPEDYDKNTLSWPFYHRLTYLSDSTIQPDLDLHVYCADGRHVGMNYVTGEYEVQIADTITNGDNIGAPEWIFFPPTSANASCKHSVSAHDNEAFLAANPEIAAGLPDTTDKYEIYARYIDPASGIHTSETLVDQSIVPGASIVHTISGTTEVVLAAGVPDTAAPVTMLAKDGTVGANVWYSGSVTVTLSASDEAGGTGVRETRYSLDSGVTWLPYSAPIVLAGDGMHAILFASSDNAGNSEASNSETVMIDSVAPAVGITEPLPSTLIGVAPVSIVGTLAEATSGVSTVSANGIGCVLAEPDYLAFACGGVPLAEGENLLEVIATDFAGNSAQASVTVTLDTTAPAVADSTVTPVGTGSSSVELSIHATDATGATTAVVSFAGPSPSSTPVGSLILLRTTGTAGDGEWTGHFDFPPVSEAPDGTYEVSVVVTDSVGNAHEEVVGSVNLDRTGSDIAAATATPQVQRPGESVMIALSAKDASSGIATVTVQDMTLGGTMHVMSLVGGSSAPGEFGAWEHNLVAALPEGEHTLQISVTDGSGNVATQPLAFSVDATAPDTVIDSAPSGTGGATASISFHASEAGEFSCKLDAGEWEPCESPATLADLLGGSHTFRVRATDIAGNVGAAAIVSWDVDATAPIVTLDSVPPAESTSTSATVAFHADDAAASFECVLDAGAWEPCASPKVYEGLVVGTHVIGVRATDIAGNIGARTNAQLSVLGSMTFHAVADTYLRNGVPNQANGAESILRIKASGDNRGLIRFDAAAIAAAIGQSSTVTSANLQLKVTLNGNNWGTSGKTVGIHRMTSPWAEAGATWKCGNDTDLGNAKPDCPSGSWDMRNHADDNPWSPQPTATMLVTNGLSGTVPFDVTSDLVAFMAGTENDGWLVRKTDENHQGLVEFGSRESGSNQPELVVTYQVE